MSRIGFMPESPKQKMPGLIEGDERIVSPTDNPYSEADEEVPEWLVKLNYKANLAVQRWFAGSLSGKIDYTRNDELLRELESIVKAIKLLK